MSFFSISLYRVYVYMSMSFYIVLLDNCFGSLDAVFVMACWLRSEAK